MLKLEYKKISDDTKKIMKDAVDSKHNFYVDAVESIQKIHPAKQTHILNSANSCIFTVACFHKL